jgi:hypothetical protein
MADIKPPQEPPQVAWTFNRQGPFYRLQWRLGLLTDTDLAAGRRAVLFLLVAWVPAIVLSTLTGNAWGDHHERSILLDFSAYAFAIAIGAFVLMEQSSDRRMAWLVRQFVATGIATPGAQSCLTETRLRLERRSGSATIEAALLVLSYLLAFGWIDAGLTRVPTGTWFGQVVDGAPRLNYAGWWIVLVALPLFWFLLLRWVWRFATWSLLLRDIARCDLRLVATHPDRCGGLAFIGQYPKTYLLFAFAVSTVVSATVLKQVVFGGASMMAFKFAWIGMILFLLAAFAAPLFFFAPLLVGLKRRGLSTYGALVSRHNLAFEVRWIPGSASDRGEDPLGSPDMSSLADLAAGYELVKNMRAAPLTKESLMPVLIAALVPVMAVAATQVPVAKILSEVKGLLLL